MTPQEFAAFSDSLTAAVLKLLRSLDRNRSRIAAQESLSFSELRAISRISEGKKITPSELATDLEMTTGAVTAITTSLVAAGLIVRVPHPTDRRSLQLELSPAGQELMGEIYDEFESTISGGAAELALARRADVVKVLMGMAAALDRVNDQHHAAVVGSRVSATVDS